MFICIQKFEEKKTFGHLWLVNMEPVQYRFGLRVIKRHDHLHRYP